MRSFPFAAMERISFNTLSMTIGMFFFSAYPELFEAGEFAYAAHFSFGVIAILLHHLAHVGVLLQHLIHFLYRSAATESAALATLAVNQVGISALRSGPGMDNGFYGAQALLVDFGVLGEIGERADLRQH